MSAEERRARGARDRSATRTLPEAHRRALEQRAIELEKLGLRMVKAAGAKRGRTAGKKAGAKLDELYAGLKVLNAADKLWGRLDRLGPATRAGGAPRPPASGVPTLEDYRKRRPARA